MIFYFGNDQNFLDRMVAFYAGNPLTNKVTVEKEVFRSNTILDKMTGVRPYAIVLDFTNTCENIEELFVKINYLKKSSKFRGIPVIGLFTDKEDFEGHRHLFALGLNYPFIKGTDERILFRDIHYLSFETDTPFAKFAKAQFNNLSYRAEQLAFIYGYTKDSVLIESDLFQNDDTSRILRIYLVDKVREQELRSKKLFEVGVLTNSLNRTEYEIPFLGPWDDPESDLIHKDSYETWIEEGSESLQTKNGRILIASENPEDFRLAGELATNFNFDIYVTETFEEAKVYLESYNFDVIFYRLSEQEEEQGSECNFENLYRLTNAVKNSENGTHTVFVAFNSPSRTNAIRKALEYEHIVSVEGDMTGEQLSSYTNVFQSKGSKNSCSTNCYSLGSKSSSLGFVLDMEISSMTEHELTFYSSEDIPMYSLLDIDVPTELQLLIVPPIIHLEHGSAGKHYMGFIVGGTETDYEVVRSFVNRAIIKGLTSFTTLPMEEEDTEEGMPEAVEAGATEIIISEKNKNDVTISENSGGRAEVVRKTNLNGKTKL